MVITLGDILAGRADCCDMRNSLNTKAERSEVMMAVRIFFNGLLPGFVLASSGCSGGSVPPNAGSPEPHQKPSAALNEPSPALSAAPQASAGTAPPIAAGSAAVGSTTLSPPQKPVPAEPPKVNAAFPPAKFAPLFERTAQPGDGTWTAMPQGADQNRSVLVNTTVHPHKIKKHIYVSIVAIDLSRVSLHLVAGTLEPKSDAVALERRTGLVPKDDQSDLIAVFNGGFMARHGNFGMKIGADVFLPPREDSCSVALLSDGAIRIQTHKELKPIEVSIQSYRQTPPCIIEKGVLNPDLETERRPRPWGAAENGDTEVRRSALGLDASGQVLFYGVGEWVTVKLLADSMKAAGAVNAAQLDINWSYTRFLFFGKASDNAPLSVQSTLIPKMKHSERGYVESASERDFFYLKKLRLK